jgi:hypothetical protein
MDLIFGEKLLDMFPLGVSKFPELQFSSFGFLGVSMETGVVKIQFFFRKL